ncbi:MAG: dephospho-CoA kinase [Lachnospiraceae bacterium]|nr:dephospho-CoA kinase [Lachnospiraceae bacterium]
MKIIGITGGVGAGKSELLSYLVQNYSCRVLLADEVGNRVKEPGQPCYHALVKLLGESVLDGNKEIDRKRMADMIFGDEHLLQRVNAIIHPAVEDYIFEQIRIERERGQIAFFFVEAALLIECGYDRKLDELWYIYAEPEIRAKRLRESRGYSDEKIHGIMTSQLSDEEFRRVCKVVIDNSGTLEQAYEQIDAALRA